MFANTLLHFSLSSSPQLRLQACHNATSPLRCVRCCSFVTPEGSSPSPRTALPEPFAARSSPGRRPRAPLRTALLGAVTRAEPRAKPAPGAPAPPAPPLLRLNRVEQRCGRTSEAASGAEPQLRHLNTSPCSDGSGGQRAYRRDTEPPFPRAAPRPGAACPL